MAEIEEAQVVSDEITCSICGNTEERVAEEGVVLQPSPDYVCENCQNAHNEASGATAAEAARLAAEQTDSDITVQVEE